MNSHRNIDRRALFASGAAAALLAATGVSAQARPVRRGRLRVALSGAERADRFDGTQSHGLFMQVAMAGIVFDTLTEVAADGTLRGELANAWQGTPDAKTWEFDLRDNVDFHDGSRFSANDVVASYTLHRDTYFADVQDISAVGPQRLRVVLKASDPDFPYRLSDAGLVIYPAENMELAMENGIGTGLYRVHRFQAGRQLLAHRVDHHYKDGAAGWFETVELMALSADAVRAEALRDHYVDAADLTHLADLNGFDGIYSIPEEDFMTAAVDHCIALPGQVGSRWPLDNLRAAERWWMV